ncbi:MAG TPA: zf-HC2 domain-containing protein [Rhizomicrobium sp.]|jgi:anti-sigma factor RsiW|nr:zf-HC2 domain-containing protein [Rhizomicrobium sp.]
MSCNEGLRLQAYFDGELDAGGVLEAERHLQNCADCATLLADLEATRKLIRRDAPYHRVDADLRKEIMSSLVPDSGSGAARRSFFGLPGRFLSGAASGAGATALAALAIVFLAVPRADPLAGDLMNAHLRSLMSDHLIDVVSSDRHTVKPWFAGHTDVSPPANDFAKQGYQLIGGRADYVDGHRAAVVVYRHGAHIINVFAWAADAAKLPADVTRQGYHIACWRGADLAYCAVSDTAPDELAALVRLLKQQ